MFETQEIKAVDYNGERQCVRCFTKKRIDNFDENRLACKRCVIDDVVRQEIAIKSEYAWPRIAGMSIEQCKLHIANIKNNIKPEKVVSKFVNLQAQMKAQSDEAFEQYASGYKAMSDLINTDK